MRDTFLHSCPSDYPQAAAGPQEAFCYPEDALPEFRKWMREEYKPKKFPNDLNGKVKQGSIPAPQATTSTRLRRFRHLARIQAWRYGIGSAMQPH